MEDILLILLAIVWTIASIYQSQRKKKKQAERKAATQRTSAGESTTEAYEQEQVDQSQGFLDKIFESLDSDQNDPYESFAEEMISDDKSADPEPLNEEEVQPEVDKPSAKASAPLKLKSPSENRKKQDWIKHLARDFDGKKAVIYSEIMNRPYS